MSRKDTHRRTLTLNADGRPLHIHNAYRATVLVLIGKAHLILGSGIFLRSSQGTVEIPSVIQLMEYVSAPAERSVPLTVRTVLARDKRQCAYRIPNICLGTATTIDHIVPRSQGGPLDWTNVAAACKKCNQKKRNRTPEEAGLTLHVKPFKPQGPGARLLLHATEPEWEPYLRF